MADCGVDAVKLQKRDNRSLFTTEYYNRPYDHANSFGATYGEHREALEFGRDGVHRAQAGTRTSWTLTFFATAFDIPSADFLDELDMPAYKIASARSPQHAAAAPCRPLRQADDHLYRRRPIEDVHAPTNRDCRSTPQLAFLQCTAGYPPEWEELDLRVIETYRAGVPRLVIGYSGHDSGIAMATAAYVLGARSSRSTSRSIAR